MKQHQVIVKVLGPWSLATSRAFWEGFAPGALTAQDDQTSLRTVFLVEQDWSAARVQVSQRDDGAQISVTGDGDLDAAVTQAARFLSLDVDARG